MCLVPQFSSILDCHGSRTTELGRSYNLDTFTDLISGVSVWFSAETVPLCSVQMLDSVIYTATQNFFTIMGA